MIKSLVLCKITKYSKSIFKNIETYFFQIYFEPYFLFSIKIRTQNREIKYKFIIVQKKHKFTIENKNEKT